ncbi:MAG: PleD family two-component system response regulator [Proteobacteria bacterium]|nr:PleD family two-component system response regulator [Pseudomonadota bacterium]
MTARILIVDDTVFNVKLLDARLKQEYYEIFTATSGMEGIQIAKEVHPDIILLDVMMPIMDGMETARRLRADPDTTYIPIIMITALDGQDDRVRGLEAGADDFVSKPVDEQGLIARIKSLLRLKFMMDELILRDKTAVQFGIAEQPTMDVSRSVDGASVLLIEDDMALSKKIHDVLQSKGIKVEDCANPNTAIEQAEQHDYSVIIVNSQVMGTDGLRICSHLKSHEALRNVPILLTVDADNKGIIMRGLEIGVNDYITTPIEVNELVARVSTQIRRRRYQDILRHQYTQSISMSVIDQLTGLYNRRYLDIHLDALVRRAHEMNRNLSLMILDLDHFKEVNDTYGHQSGDAILKELGQRVMGSVRVTDLCARYGGEEFVVLMSDTDESTAMTIAERMRHAIADRPMPIVVPPGQITKTGSIGVAGLREGESAAALLGRADNLLYYAKDGGRNRVVNYAIALEDISSGRVVPKPGDSILASSKTSAPQSSKTPVNAPTAPSPKDIVQNKEEAGTASKASAPTASVQQETKPASSSGDSW